MPCSQLHALTRSGNLFGALRRFAATLRRPPRAVMAVALLVVLGMFATNTDWGGDPDTPRGDGTYRPVLARGDGHMTYLMARSFVLDQDLVFDNDLARFGDPWNQRRTATGRKDIPHPFGPVLVWSPFLVTAHGLSKVVNAFGGDIPSHGYTMFHHRIVFGTSCLFAFFAVVLGLRVARRWVGGRWGPVYAAVAVLFGTSLTYYATYMPSYGHAMDAFFCAAFLATWACTYGDDRWRRYVYLGLLLGVAALVRAQNLSLGIALAVEIAARGLGALPEGTTRARHVGDLVLRGLVTLGVGVVAFTPQMIAWKVVYGEWLTSPNGPRYVRLSHPMILELMFSSRNGWLSTTPIAYFGLAGLLFVPKRARVIAGGLLAVIAMQIWINASVIDWWASASFGQRRMCSVTLPLVVGLSALLWRGNRLAHRLGEKLPRRAPVWTRHLVAALVLGWFVVWNVAQVQQLRRGKAAGRGTGPSCCARAPEAMQKVAQPIYDTVGNPFAFPANAIFALRWGVDLQRWDEAVGNYVFVPGWYEYNDGRYKRRRGKWHLGEGGRAPYILDGFGESVALTYRGQRRSIRWTKAPEARALVPILLPEAHRLFQRLVVNGLPGDPPVRVVIRVNGDVRFDEELAPGWHDVHFDVPYDGLVVGENVVTFEAPLSPWADHEEAPPRPPRGGDVGIGVAALHAGFPPEPTEPR